MVGRYGLEILGGNGGLKHMVFYFRYIIIVIVIQFTGIFE